MVIPTVIVTRPFIAIYKVAVPASRNGGIQIVAMGISLTLRQSLRRYFDGNSDTQ